MTANEIPELLGHREGDHKVGNREEHLLLLFQPFLPLIILTRGAVSVLTGMVAVVVLLTGLTEIYMTSESLRAALLDGLHSLEMAWKHPSPELLLVLGSMNAEDIGYIHHHRSAMI